LWQEAKHQMLEGLDDVWVSPAMYPKARIKTSDNRWSCEMQRDAMQAAGHQILLRGEP